MSGRRKVKNNNFGVRNEKVVPVGAWVELAPQAEHFHQTAIISAQIEESKARRYEYEKAERLARFRRDVKQRVRRHHKLRQAREVQMSCQAAELQQRVVNQTIKSADKILYKKGTCSFRSGEPVAVINEEKPAFLAEAESINDGEGGDAQYLHQQSKEIGRIVKQAKRDLAGRRIGLEKGNVPGGSWGLNYTRDKPASLSQLSEKTSSDSPPWHSVDDIGSYDSGETKDSLDMKLQTDFEGQMDDEWRRKTEASNRKTVTFDPKIDSHDFNEVKPELSGRGHFIGDMSRTPVASTLFPKGQKLTSNRSVHASNDTGKEVFKSSYSESQNSDYQLASNRKETFEGMKSNQTAAQRLHETVIHIPDAQPGIAKEEHKRQIKEQYSMYRKLFMDMEREQVKENIRKKQHQKRIQRLKKTKEEERKAVERITEKAIEARDPYSGQTEEEAVQWEEDEERRVEELIDRQNALEKKNKETERYIKALKAMMKERIVQQGVKPPPLCACGPSIWDSNPETCANNCFFYKNPKGYAKALASLLASCDIS